MKKIIAILLFLTACSAQSTPKIIKGNVYITPSFNNKTNPSDALYILVYKNIENSSTDKSSETQADAAPSYLKEEPLLIKKISPVIFPQPFEVGDKDTLFPENRLEGSVHLVARLSKNGTPTAQNGDLEGSCNQNPIQVGSKNVEITISKEIKDTQK